MVTGRRCITDGGKIGGTQWQRTTIAIQRMRGVLDGNDNFARREDSPCYACLFPPDQQFEEVACATMGVFAPLVGIIGSMQAAEALKLVSGCGEPLVGKMLLLEAMAMEWNQLCFGRNAQCGVCGGAIAT